MAGSLLKIALMGLLLGAAPVARAETPEAIDHDQATIHSELIGAPVFAADGMQIGEVSDISYDQDEQPKRIRMIAGSVLGLGTRTLEIPAGYFMVLRGAVVVDLPADAVQALPELSEQEDER